jgi:hypothetical protein
MNAVSCLGSIAIALGCAVVAFGDDVPCASCEQPACAADDSSPSWVFRRSTYTHDPVTGARVAQYQRLPAIQPLEDERLVTSRYHRMRTDLRGTNGSVESIYDVQSWGNGRGGMDAEWERFHDAWKESYLQGGYYNYGPGYGNVYPNQFGYGHGGFGNSGSGFYPGIGGGGQYWDQ